MGKGSGAGGARGGGGGGGSTVSKDIQKAKDAALEFKGKAKTEGFNYPNSYLRNQIQPSVEKVPVGGEISLSDGSVFVKTSANSWNLSAGNISMKVNSGTVAENILRLNFKYTPPRKR